METRLVSVIWAAGFFDGEGCIQIQHRAERNGGSYFMSVTAAQKDPAPLFVFRALFGGSVHHSKRSDSRYGCDMWQWRVTVRQAERCLRELEPYLIVKREQARVALVFQARRLERKDRQNREKIATQYEKDEADLVQLKALKRAPLALPVLIN